jgi:hypothetical protein
MQSSTVLCNALYDDLMRVSVPLVIAILGPTCGPLTCRYYISQARITFETCLSILSTRFCCRMHLFASVLNSFQLSLSFHPNSKLRHVLFLFCTLWFVLYCLSLRRQRCKDRLLRCSQRPARFRLLESSPVDHSRMTMCGGPVSSSQHG